MAIVKKILVIVKKILVGLFTLVIAAFSLGALAVLVLSIALTSGNPESTSGTKAVDVAIREYYGLNGDNGGE